MANHLIHHFLENSAARYPDKTAIIHDKERATYRQIKNQADRLATFLSDRGIHKGDRVILLWENSIDYVVSYYGILKAGAVAVPLSTDLKPDSLNPLLVELEPAAVIADARFERLLQASDLNVANLSTVVIRDPNPKWDSSIPIISFERIVRPENSQKTRNAHIGHSGVGRNPENDIRPGERLPRTRLGKRYIDFGSGNRQATIKLENQIEPPDLASIIYTSGSTGKPKGVMLTHGNIVANTHSICQYLQLSPDDIQMVVLPFFYVMGKSLLNTIFSSGGTLVLNNKFAFPASVINQMMDENVTIFSGVPSTYSYLLHRSPLKQKKPDLSNLRMVTQAGGHMARSVKKNLRRALPSHTKICIMYGATEASARLTMLDPERFEEKIDSIGRAIPNVRIRILDSKGVEVPRGQMGEVVAAGANIMVGYWKDPQATEKALVKNSYHTGDIGWQDEEGFIFLEGRKDNLLKVGGHRINPQEVEDALLATQLAVEATVVGVPDDLLGNRLVALLVPLNADIGPNEVLIKASAILSKYKLPSEVRFVKSLPKNASGKVNRKMCLDVAAADHITY